MAKFTSFTQKIPVASDFIVGYQQPGGAGDDVRFLMSDIFSFVTSSLGTAALLNTGAGAGELPTNAAISAAFQPINTNLTSLSALGLAADRVSYTIGINTYAETALTAFGRSLIDDVNASAARTTLALIIGTDVQAQNDILDDIAGLTQTNDRLIYFDSASSAAITPLTAFMRTLLGNATALLARGTLILDTTDDVEFEDIKTNTRFLGKRGPDTASTNDITLGDGNYFVITGTTTINTIDATGWTAGSIITLEMASGATVTLADRVAGAGAELSLEGSANQAMTVNDTIMLQYNGVVWKQVAPKVVI